MLHLPYSSPNLLPLPTPLSPRFSSNILVPYALCRSQNYHNEWMNNKWIITVTKRWWNECLDVLSVYLGTPVCVGGGFQDVTMKIQDLWNNTWNLFLCISQENKNFILNICPVDEADVLKHQDFSSSTETDREKQLIWIKSCFEVNSCLISLNRFGCKLHTQRHTHCIAVL